MPHRPAAEIALGIAGAWALVAVLAAATRAAPMLAPAVGAFYVAASGSDANDGSRRHPFATLAHARAVMEQGPVRTCYVGGGRYRQQAPLVLSARDSGATFRAWPGRRPVLSAAAGFQGPVVAIQGARRVTLSGLGVQLAGEGTAIAVDGGGANTIDRMRIQGARQGIVLTGSSGNAILGNTLVHSGQAGIELRDGSDRNTIAGNVVDGTDSPGEQGGGILLHGASGNRIAGNTVENTAGIGIGIQNWDDTTINRDNRVERNLVRNTSRHSTDSGAIYMLGRSQVDTRTVIADNLVDGTGAGGDAHTIGIYLDDSTSGVQVTGNVVRNVGTHAMELHGGSGNLVRANVFDLGAGATSAILFQAAPADTHPGNAQTGNVVRNNLIVASGHGQTAYSWLEGGAPLLLGNDYAGIGPDQVRAGPSVDAAARFHRRPGERWATTAPSFDTLSAVMRDDRR